MIDTSDNKIAIKMLRDIASILMAIEHDDFNYIRANLTDLKNRISEFEEIMYQNKADGMYKNKEKGEMKYYKQVRDENGNIENIEVNRFGLNTGKIVSPSSPLSFKEIGE